MTDIARIFVRNPLPSATQISRVHEGWHWCLCAVPALAATTASFHFLITATRRGGPSQNKRALLPDLHKRKNDTYIHTSNLSAYMDAYILISLLTVHITMRHRVWQAFRSCKGVKKGHAVQPPWAHLFFLSPILSLILVN